LKQKIETDIKTDPRSFFKFADMKRNSSGYPSSMFFKDYATRNPQENAPDDDSSNMLVKYPHKVSFIQFTEAGVAEVILSLDEQNGSGPDGISPSIVKKLTSVVKASLTSSGTFPFVWKESFIVNIFNSGEKHDISPAIAEFQFCP
jgi:hypothetical protein